MINSVAKGYVERWFKDGVNVNAVEINESHW